jgi:hypothetical protein
MRFDDVQRRPGRESIQLPRDAPVQRQGAQARQGGAGEHNAAGVRRFCELGYDAVERQSRVAVAGRL